MPGIRPALCFWSRLLRDPLFWPVPPLAAAAWGAVPCGRTAGIPQGIALHSLGILVAACGSWVAARSTPGSDSRGRLSAGRLVGCWLAAGGLALVLDRPAASAVLVAAAAVTLALGKRLGRDTLPRSKRDSSSNPGTSLFPLGKGKIVAVVAALGLLVVIVEATASRGDTKSYLLEVGWAVTLLSLLLAGLWARTVGAAAACRGIIGAPGKGSARTRRLLLAGFIGLAGAFLALGLSVRHDPVRAADAGFSAAVALSGGAALTTCMERVSSMGGRDLLLIWLPLLLTPLVVARHFFELRMLLAGLLGSVGLELFFKTLFSRPRPDHVRHLDSFPSGHVLAAAVLCGLLVVLLSPHCRRGWQKVLLWAAGIGWPLLMAAARVYLGRHFLGDVLGSLLLAGAWVCLVHWLICTFAPKPFPALPSSIDR